MKWFPSVLFSVAASFITTTPLLSQIPTDGLVAYYPFNGNADDESGNGNNGTVSGPSPASDRFGESDHAFLFDGVDDLISVPNSPSLQSVDSSVSLAIWVYVNDWDNTWAGVAAKSNTAARGQYGIAFQPGGRIDVDLSGTYTSIYSAFRFVTGRWYFLCMTWDGDFIVVYVNGNMVGSSASSPGPMSNEMPLEIGRHTPTNTEYMNGFLDDARVYSRSLAADEVDQLFREGGWPPYSEDLLAYYPFNGNANDVSGHENHGVLLGGATATNYLRIADNADDALSLPHTVLDGLTDFTFAAVVQIDNVHLDGGHLVAANAWITGAASFHPGGNGFNITYDGTIQHWRILIVPPYQVNYFFDYDTRIEDHLPHHIAVSRVGNEARLYLDGVIVGNPTIVPDAHLECDPDGFIIGQDQDFVGGGFDANQCLAGGVDNLRVFSRALTDTEVMDLCIEDGILVTSAPAIASGGEILPHEIRLHQNFPNPFNPVTTIQYEVPTAQHVRISVFSVLGEKIADLVDSDVAPGMYSVVFDGRQVGSGTYFYRMEAANHTETRKLIVLK